MFDKLQNKLKKDVKLNEQDAPLFKQSIDELNKEYIEFQKKYQK